MKVDIKDQYNNRPVYTGEKGNTMSITEQTGYVPANVMIERLIYAGMRLNHSRGVYDSDGYEGAHDDMEISPVRRPGVDITEVELLARQSMSNIEKQTEEFLKEQEIEKAKILPKKEDLE